MADPKTPEQWAKKISAELNIIALDYGHDDIISVHANEAATLMARSMAEFRDADVERRRAELAAFVPPGALSAGEIPALCGTCKELLCVPGLPGCARCVGAEIKRMRASLSLAKGIERDRDRLFDERRTERVLRKKVEAERDRLIEQAARARAKHRTPAERDDPDHPLCSCGLQSPCPTRRALDGTEAGT